MPPLISRGYFHRSSTKEGREILIIIFKIDGRFHQSWTFQTAIISEITALYKRAGLNEAENYSLQAALCRETLDWRYSPVTKLLGLKAGKARHS